MKKAIILMILVSAVSCAPYDIEEILLPREDISLTIKGEDQFSYDPLTCQAAHNSTIHEYRVFDDKLSEWFIVRCSDRPSNEGQELTADITWTASSSTKTMNSLEFRIEKMEQDGRIWMWCKKKKVGIVIKNL